MIANFAFNLAMKHNQERKRKLRLSREGPSQPPGRSRRVQKGQGGSAFDEVKGVCPESDPEPRECVKFGEGRSFAKGRRQQSRERQRRAPRHTPGVADSIESDRGYVATRRRAELLGDGTPRVPASDHTRELQGGFPLWDGGRSSEEAG